MAKKMKRIFTYLSLSVLIFLSLNPAFALQSQIHYPKRIVSLDPALTEQLYLLGVEDRVVGVTTYCPPQARIKEKIGSLRTVDLEKILSLQPDLVLSGFFNEPIQIKKLRSLKIRVVSFTKPKSFSEICSQCLEIGKLIGKEKEAKEIIKKAQGTVRFIKQKTSGLPRPKVFIQVGTNPLYTITRDSFPEDFITIAGGINIAHDAKSRLYSREEVIKRNPDVIIIVTHNIVGEQEKEIWQNFKALKAVENGRIYVIDADKICRPTPASFVETLQEIFGFLSGDKD
jgi:iron complex transport system substrate-binding protein